MESRSSKIIFCLAKLFESQVLSDERFEVCNRVRFGLVCFRLKGSDELNKRLLLQINDSGKLFMVSAFVNNQYAMRFVIVDVNSTHQDIGKILNSIYLHIAQSK